MNTITTAIAITLALTLTIALALTLILTVTFAITIKNIVTIMVTTTVSLLLLLFTIIMFIVVGDIDNLLSFWLLWWLSLLLWRTRIRTTAVTTTMMIMMIKKMLLMRKRRRRRMRSDMRSVKPRTTWGVYTWKRLHTWNLRDGFSDIRHPSFRTWQICDYLLSDYHCRSRCSRATQWFPQSKPTRLQDSQFVLIFNGNKSIALIWFHGKPMMIASIFWCEAEFQQGKSAKKSGQTCMFHLAMADWCCSKELLFCQGKILWVFFWRHGWSIMVLPQRFLNVQLLCFGGKTPQPPYIKAAHAP